LIRVLSHPKKQEAGLKIIWAPEFPQDYKKLSNQSTIKDVIFFLKGGPISLV